MFERGGKLLKLAVVPEWRRRGAGSFILDAALSVLDCELRKFCSCVVLHVDPENVAAAHLYESRGFSRDCTVRDYYGPGRDAWRMMRLRS